MTQLTDKEILDVACKHCEFSGEGTYHLRKYTGEWSIVRIVRECMELAELVKQATAPPVGADTEGQKPNKPESPGAQE